MGALTEISSNKIFGGFQKVFSYQSKCLASLTKFGVYLPPQAEEKKLPVIYWLSGLTCSEANFIEKSGAQRYAAEHGVIIMGALTEISSNKIFGGFQKVFSYESKCLASLTKFGVYMPPQAEEKKLPVIYWLSGLTCSEANFIEKSGAQRYAAEHGVIIVNPDTSPRNLNIAGDSESWDFGVGAGFYVDATQEPWKNNYKMFTYVTSELIQVINDNFPILPGKQAIMGHSMGGHGALICALKNPGLYKSVSAFAPICNPSECPWGVKAFTGYLGPKETGEWAQWDATELVKNYNGPPLELFIDQGSEDNFLHAQQLLPENLIESCKTHHMPVIFKKREGYNHSYFYIASFVEEHIKYHMENLTK